ncbi:hypothetical protein HYU22_02710 [Candidatus Woesearchaeota archaeon]|nr:hypothetical protein [Candidatus Woesearchaeota archaeon]
MKPRWSTIAILCIAIALTACSSDQQTQQKGAYIGGTDGVTADFEAFGVEEDSVFTIFDTESFPIELTLKNKGEYDLQPRDIKVRLLGPAPTEFSGIASRELQNQQAIDKISELTPTGGEETITFARDAKYQGIVPGVIDREWFANVEYKYQTYGLVPEVCLKEDLTDKRICDVKQTKEFFVSGAPVTITTVEEDTAGRGIMALKFTIKNVGGGDVAKVGGEFGVHDQLAYSMDDSAWECKSGGRVNEARLIEDQAEIVCKLKQPLQKNDLFTKQVKLTLEYTYRSIVQEKLRIKESAR